MVVHSHKVDSIGDEARCAAECWCLALLMCWPDQPEKNSLFIAEMASRDPRFHERWIVEDVEAFIENRRATGELHSQVQGLCESPSQLMLQDSASKGEAKPVGHTLDVEPFRGGGPYRMSDPPPISTEPPTHVPVWSEPVELLPASTVAIREDPMVDDCVIDLDDTA